MPDNALNQKLGNTFTVMTGIYMASHGNGILGQNPTSILK